MTTALMAHDVPDVDEAVPPAGVIETALAIAASASGLTPDDLRGRSRDRQVVHARQIAVFLLRRADLSLPAIGRALGGRDHTTVLHALHRISDRMDRQPVLRADVEELARRAAPLRAVESLETDPRPTVDIGAVAVVHPRLSEHVAAQLRSAGFTRLAATDGREIWVRYPAA